MINYFQKEYSNLAVSNEKPSFPEFMLTNSEKVSYNVTDRGIFPQTLQAKEQSIMEKNIRLVICDIDSTLVTSER